MKKIIAFVLVLVSLNAFAQVDSAKLTLTVELPQKAIALFGYKLKTDYNWAHRKAPDQLIGLLGSGTKPDSLVNVTVQAGILADFIGWMLSQPYGAINTVARSILSNSPAISGYSALTTQVVSKANGSSGEKAAATYVVGRYNVFTNFQTAFYNEIYQSGVSWIRD